jgi:hypothetical protein
MCLHNNTTQVMPAAARPSTGPGVQAPALLPQTWGSDPPVDWKTPGLHRQYR